MRGQIGRPSTRYQSPKLRIRKSFELEGWYRRAGLLAERHVNYALSTTVVLHHHFVHGQSHGLRRYMPHTAYRLECQPV